MTPEELRAMAEAAARLRAIGESMRQALIALSRGLDLANQVLEDVEEFLRREQSRPRG